MIGAPVRVGGGVISVGIGEAAWATGGGRLSTVGLGSCIAVAIHDPAARVGGLIHFQLPDSAHDPERGVRQPYLFADTGLSALVGTLGGRGVLAPRSRVAVVGGAQMIVNVAAAQVGKRNALAARKALWKFGFLIEREVVGGSVSRSVSLDVTTGEVVIREHGGTP